MWQDALIAIHQRALRHGARRKALVAPLAQPRSVDRAAAQLPRVAAVQAAVDAARHVPQEDTTPSRAAAARQARSQLLHASDEAYAVTQGMLKLNAQLLQDSSAAAHDAQEATMKLVSSAAMEYPVVLAAEAAAVMLKAGHVTQATELLAFWAGRRSNDKRVLVTRRQRRAMYSCLREAIVTLGKMRDVTTLRHLAGVLIAAYHAQQTPATATITHVRGKGSTLQSSSTQYKLLGVLHTRALHELLCDCVAELCGMKDDSHSNEGRSEAEGGVPLLEKLTLLGQTIVAPHTEPGGGHSPVGPVARRGEGTACVRRYPYLPLKLQHVFARHVECDAQYSEELVQQVCPRLLQALVPPARLDLLQLLTMSAKEVRRACAMWPRAQRALALDGLLPPAAPPPVLPEPSWSALLHRLMHSSRALKDNDALHAMQLNALLLTLRESAAMHQSSDTQAQRATVLNALRVQLVRDGLRATHAEERYAASKALLLLRQSKTHTRASRGHLLRALGLSPRAVATVYALSFWTDRAVLPRRRARLCARLLRHNCRCGRYSTAAQLVSNHLCVAGPATRRLFRRSSTLSDMAVLSVCRAVQEEQYKASGEDSARRAQALRHWRGHRALALLRVLGAAGRATPAHCVPLCVAALRCGLPFSAVQQTLPAVLTRPETARWTMDLVRLCMDSHEVRRAIRVPHGSKTAQLVENTHASSPLTHSACKEHGGTTVHVCLPHKSKQRALWALLHGSTPVNRTLATLVTSLYFDDRVRRSLLNCDHWLPREPRGKDVREATCECDEARIAALSRFYRWEVAASIASCCSTREAYRAMLRALLTHAPPAQQSAASLHQLLASETDEGEITGSAAAARAAAEGKAKAQRTAHTT